MQKTAPHESSALPGGFFVAPIHPADATAPLWIAVLGRWESSASEDPFVLLREVPGARVYLGAVCDAAARILWWLELYLQTAGLPHSALAAQNHPITNLDLDRRWQAELAPDAPPWPADTIILGLERANPAPVLVKRMQQKPPPLLAETELSPLRLCQDDALLQRAGLPAYSSSLARYLHRPDETGSPRFWAATTAVPMHPGVESFGALAQAPDVLAVFNPQAGRIRARKLVPLALEDYLDILEGGNWKGFRTGNLEFFVGHEYERLRLWTGNREAGSCLLHGHGPLADRLTEILFLKLGLLLDLFEIVRDDAGLRRAPLLNLSPASFQLALAEVGGHFPLLWSAKARLVRPGQAYPLELAGFATPFFVRMGELEPSPFMPEGLNAHSFGMGSVLLRQILEETDGIVLEGTLRTTEYLRVAPDDLIWLQLPVAATERAECYARNFAGESKNPREIRFRSLPRLFPPQVLEALRQHSGATLPRSPFEIWPVLSTPCDLFSLAVIALRTLLANRQTNLPVLLDDLLSLSRTLASGTGSGLSATLAARLLNEPELAALIGPHRLTAEPVPADQALEALPLQLWADAICWLLRLFPGVPDLSYCRNMGDVSPLAPETVFDAPLRDLRGLVLRARSLVLPGNSAHADIVQVLREALKQE